MWVEVWVRSFFFLFTSSSLLRRFFSGFSGFPPSTKPTFFIFQFDLEAGDEEPFRGFASVNYLFIVYLFII